MRENIIKYFAKVSVSSKDVVLISGKSHKELAKEISNRLVFVNLF
jgi:uncharacterized protein YggU (UPF0235/DUF167 family)